MTADVWIENIIMIGTGLVLFILAFYYKKNPPKKINHIYGYRTRRSMANQEIWDAANAHSSKSFFKLSVLVLVIGIAFCFFNFGQRMAIQVIVLLFGLAYSIWETQSYLNTHFDKQGNRK